MKEIQRTVGTESRHMFTLEDRKNKKKARAVVLIFSAVTL